jgi:hypothetical protein
LIVNGDECAVGLNELFLSTGHKAAVKGGINTIKCLVTIWKLYKKEKVMLTEIWPLIADVNQECMIKDVVVRSIFWTEFQVRKDGMTLTKHPFRSYLIKRGGEAINAEIRKEITIIGRGGARIEANALIKFINKARINGKNKIKLIE